MEKVQHRIKRWTLTHLYIFAIALFINVVVLLSTFSGCAIKKTGRTVIEKEWGYVVSRGGWSPNPKEVEQIFREELAKWEIDRPPRPYFLFMNVERGLTFTSIPPLIIVEPGKDWQEVLRHELQHLFFWIKTGNGEFHRIH